MFFISRFSEEKNVRIVERFCSRYDAYMLNNHGFHNQRESMREMLHNTPQLFADAIDRIQMNLLVISPVFTPHGYIFIRQNNTIL